MVDFIQFVVSHLVDEPDCIEVKEIEAMRAAGAPKEYITEIGRAHV